MSLERQKYKAARKQIFNYIEEHPSCTRAEILVALQWSAEKVDAFLCYGKTIGVLETSESAAGEPLYHLLDLRSWLIKRKREELMEERSKLPPEPDDITSLITAPWGEKSDIYEYLIEHNLL